MDFKKNKNIQSIGLWGVPRSGTSWLGQIFNSAPNTIYRFQPLFSLLFKNGLSQNSTKENIEVFLNKIIETDDQFIKYGMLNNKEKLMINFKKNQATHLVMKHVRYINIIENLLDKCNDIKIIGIIRNPLSVLASWFNAEKEFKERWNILDEWKIGNKKNLNRDEEFYGYNKWKQAARLFEEYNNNNNNFYLVKYNNLLLNTNEEVKNIFKFSKIKYTHQTEEFIKRSKKINHDHDYSIFKIKNNDNNWEKVLPFEITDFVMKDLENTILKKYLN